MDVTVTIIYNVNKHTCFNRYHVKCSGNKRLYYKIVGQSMQDTATCSNMPGVCVDRLRLIFPGLGDCERCSSMSSPTNANCMDRSGLGTELLVEFIANRERNFPGFEILVDCIDPEFDQSSMSNSLLKRQVQEECTSPDGMGPRPLPQLPPPVSIKYILSIGIYSKPGVA